MFDEGPSQEDIERFSGDTGFCPQCGEEIYDDADICPECGTRTDGNTSSRKKFDQWWRQRTILWITLILLLVFVGTWVF